MKCHFCQQECVNSSFKWTCDKHSVEVAHFLQSTSDDNQQHSDFITISCYHRGCLYAVWFYLNREGFVNFPHCQIKCYGNAERARSEVILSLDFFPAITPENLANKLPIYLTFL